MKTRSILREDKLSGFAPVADRNCRVLILGSMPGAKSLQEVEYYAHPRNAFWKIIESLFDINSSAAYSSRCSGLVASNIALWDVLKHCRREGSLDAKIEKESEVANDFPSLLEQYPEIRNIYFNGSKAETAFKQHVKKQLTEMNPEIEYSRLPSTSPAYAALSFEEKLEQWKVIKEVLGR